MIKKFIYIVILIFSAALFSETKKEIVGIYNITARNVDENSADTVSDILRSEIAKTGKFEVLDRSNMDKILQEQNFQTSGITNSDDAVKAGKILNVDLMAFGSFSKLGKAYVISIQMVNVESGKIIYSENEKFNSIEDSDVAIKKIIQKIANQKVAGAENIYITPFTGKEDIDTIIAELQKKNTVSYDKRSKYEIIGYLYDYDEILEDYYVFMLYKKIDIPTKKIEIKAACNNLPSITFIKPHTSKAAKKAFDAGQPFSEQAKVFYPSEGDPRKFEYRVYQKNGQPVAVEIYMVTRNADWTPREAKTLKYVFKGNEE